MKLDQKGLTAVREAYLQLTVRPVEPPTIEAFVEVMLTEYCKATGTVIVPREPTTGMVIAGFGWREFDIPDHWEENMRVPYGAYRAMIQAAQESD